MGSLFGGGGGSPPAAPKLQQVDTSMTGPLYTKSAAMGDKWAKMMRASYGLGPASAGAPATPWMQPLGKGALAMMGQADIPFEGQQDPQVQGVLQKGFGAPSYEGAGGDFGAGGGGGAGSTWGSTWNLGTNPFQMAKTLGKAPLSELQRNQNFEMGLEKQWQPPNLRLTGEDLLSVKMQQMTQNAQQQQQAYQAALQGAAGASAAQTAASGAETAALGKLGVAGINAFTSPSLNASGYYQPSPFAAMFGASSGPVSNVSFDSPNVGEGGVTFDQGGTSSFGS